MCVGRPPPVRRRVSVSPSSAAYSSGLLEVVTEDLVELDQFGAALLEPLREAPWSSARVDFGSAS